MNGKIETTTWVDIKDVKEASPIDLSEYVVTNQIADKPAFAWWVPYTPKKTNTIISKIKTNYWRTTHNYGVRLPDIVTEVIQIDQANGNIYGKDKIDKETKKAKIAYKLREDCTPKETRKVKVDDMHEYQYITCHVIFEVKINFTLKARFVANGGNTESPVTLTYSKVVSRDTVRLVLLIEALNDLDVMACYIGNAYLNAACKEEICFKEGKECSDHQWKVMILLRALFGIKTSGASWRSMFKGLIEKNPHFKSTRIDPDMYIKINRRENGT